jgi:serine/threonine protein kinase
VIGETIGNFRVTSRLGAGGMGEVFLAEQKSIETKVAIKVLRPEISVDRQHVDRFFNEARAVSRIKHAGTVKIFDVGFHSTGHAYLVMEFLEGETLASRIHRVTKMPLSQICDVGRQASGVLEATHSAGITHRDLKPDNIFLCPDSELASGERVKILDFGIAKLSGQTAAGGPRTVGTMGTPAYMAPEQWGDAAKVDWRADIYSLGCLVFEMATGRPPFIATNFAEACGLHLAHAPPKLRTIAPELPEQLETMIDAMLAKSPYSRPPLRDIAKTFSDLGVGASHVAVSSPFLPVAPPVAPTMAADAPTHAPAVHSPTPVYQQTPRHPTPVPIAETVASSPAIPVQRSEPPKPQTTLSSASGPAAPEKKSRAAIYAIAGVVVVGGGIAAIVAASSGGGGVVGGAKKKVDRQDPVTAPPPADAAPAVIADAAPLPPVPTWTKPTFTDINGYPVMARQVTRAMYKDYLGSVAKADATKLTPLKDWSDDRPTEPVGWVSYEQAAAFCAAAGGTLPSNTKWLEIAKGSWHIGVAAPGTLVFRDWTSTVTSDGLAVVLGGTSKMPEGARMAAVKNPLSKPTEASAGPNPIPESIASATIGIRCVK